MRRLCVICGSGAGHDPACRGLAESLGRALVTFLDHPVATRFVRPAHRALLLAAATPDALLAQFAAHPPPAVGNWVTPAET